MTLSFGLRDFVTSPVRTILEKIVGRTLRIVQSNSGMCDMWTADTEGFLSDLAAVVQRYSSVALLANKTSFI